MPEFIALGETLTDRQHRSHMGVAFCPGRDVCTSRPQAEQCKGTTRVGGFGYEYIYT